MDQFLKLDIFFFITSLFVIVLTIGTAFILFYIIKILRAFADISETLKSTAHTAEQKIEHISTKVVESSLFHFFFRPKKKRADRSAKDA